MSVLRPDWTTVRRPNPLGPPIALAVADASCFCGTDVVAHEPIVCLGTQTVQEPDGSRSVDLSGTLWSCDRGHA